jgi:hypothetical protein
MQAPTLWQLLNVSYAGPRSERVLVPVKIPASSSATDVPCCHSIKPRGMQVEGDGRLVYTAPSESAESTTANIRTKEAIPKDCPVYAFEVEVVHAHGPPTPSRIGELPPDIVVVAAS